MFQSGRTMALEAPEVVAGRFRLERVLGSGGMATVYDAFDLSTQRSVAIKRLHVVDDERKRRRAVELFEREFFTLSHLAHPSVVAVHDYGLDQAGPYYTMELLDGGDLQQLAPLPWRRACEIARAICSVLSLVHSRRLVYRDLNPRNVRCTPGGRAKLIDFGAMSNMGPIKHVVGTPAYCAPEALDCAPLDARTDLYSLGATLYFMLTGRHAYPAKSFVQLRSFWESRPLRPAELVSELPPALDALVMDLIHLEPGVRPANAAEVLEQLAVIEGRTFDELPQVTQAYLSAPNLVGRAPLLTRVHAKLSRCLRGHGGSLLIDGPAGVGRSRMLNACVLEAKLAGALTLHADASDADGDYGVIRALGNQLLEAAPDVARQAARTQGALLAYALPELREARSSQPVEVADVDPVRQRAQVMSALREWLLAISRQRPLCIAVDDLQAIDEPSAAALALLAHDSEREPLLILAALESSAAASANAAVKLFGSSSSRLRLVNLRLTDTEELLRSVFGDVPQVQMVAHKLHAITEGNPRDVMQLAQYLVDRGLASYRSGAWLLPNTIDDADLPADMAQALRAKVDVLSDKARELGQCLTLCDDRSLSFDECVEVMGERAPAAVLDALGELQRAQIVSQTADGFAITQRGFVAALQSGLPPNRAQHFHLGIAEVFRKRGDEEFRRSQQLVRGGREQEGVDVLVAFAAESQRRSAGNPHEYIRLVQTLPNDWQRSYQLTLDLCLAANRPARDAYTLRLRFSSLVNVMALPSSLSHPWLHALLRQLEALTGLTDLAGVDPELPPVQRARTVLGLAQRRYEQASEHDRIIDAATALSELARTVIVTMGTIATTLDHALWRVTTALTPFAPLSPAVATVEQLRLGVGARVSGRLEQSIQIYRELVERTGRPDLGGLVPANHHYLRYGVICGLGFLEAPLGLESSLKWAADAEDEPLHQITTHQIRMLYHLWMGQVHDADRDKEQLELARIQSSARQLSDGPYLLSRLTANAAADDLTRIRHTLDEIKVLAARHTAWKPVLDFGRGEYQRIRGDLEQALSLIENALSGMQVGQHQIWSQVAASHVRVLSELGRHARAVEVGEAYLQGAEAEQLGYCCAYIKLPLSLSLAACGDHERAARLADAAISNFEAVGCRGLHLLLAHETRARVALLARDMETYGRYARLCHTQCTAANSRVLSAKYERLKRDAHEIESPGLSPAVDPIFSVSGLLGSSQLTSVLVGCNQPAERAQRVLELLLRRAGVSEGFLYLLSAHANVLSAQVGSVEPSRELAGFVDDYLDAQLEDGELNTRSQESNLATIQTAAVWVDGLGRGYHPILLSHQNNDGAVVTGLAIAVVRPGQRVSHPGTLASHVSRLLQDAGDTQPAQLQ